MQSYPKTLTMPKTNTLNETPIKYDQFKILEPMVIYARILGMFPVSYRLNGSNYVIFRSQTATIYSYILGISLGLAAVFGIVRDLVAGPEESFRLTNPAVASVVCSDLAVTVCLMLVPIITSHRNHKYLFKIFNLNNEIDMYIPIRFERKQAKINIFTIVIVTLAFILLAIADMYKFMEKKCNDKRPASRFLSMYIPYYIVYTILIGQEYYFWFLSNMVRKRFWNFGRYLERKIEKIQKFEYDIKSDIMSEKEAIDLTKVHILLCEAIDNLENYCRLSVLMIVSSCLLHLIITPYFFLLVIKRYESVDTIMIQIFWIITHSLRLFFIVEPFDSSIKENANNLNLIFKLISFCMNDNVKKQLVLLSHQMSHRKASFSACGMFTINRSMITTMIGAITTYLVILFQFLGEQES